MTDYKPMEVHTIEIKSVHCPYCKRGKEFSHRVDHLFEEPCARADGCEAGPWYCDACGRAFVLRAWPDGRVEWAPSKQYKIKVRTRLQLEVDADPLYFDLTGWRYASEGDDLTEDERLERSRYYYEEHTCPTNVLGRIDEVFRGETEDPHGIFALVSEKVVQ